jgi:hypothetical protein
MDEVEKSDLEKLVDATLKDITLALYMEKKISPCQSCKHGWDFFDRNERASSGKRY